MKIEAKYNIGQTVFYMYDNKVQQSEIISINISVSKTYYTNQIEIKYTLDHAVGKCDFVKYNEKYLFETKQELLDSL